MHTPTRRPWRHLARLAVASLALSAACSASRPLPTADGPLRVGTSGDYPPFSVRAADGGPTGFDVEVARAFAAATGRRLELVPFRWPDLAAAVTSGAFDVAMSGVTVRGDRLLAGRMTAAVARADAVLLVRRGEPSPRTAAGTRVAVNRGGHLERVARARLPHATLVTVDDNRSLPRLLATREVDGVVTDTLEAATFDGAGFTIAATLARDRKAYWVAPGRDALADELEAWLLARERDGTLPRLRATYLPGARASTLPPEIVRIVDLVGRRLLVMPMVAAAKRAAALPLVDPAREARVITAAVERARAAGLDPGGADRLARAQIAAARAVQEQDREVPGTIPPTLATIRTAIDALDAALLRALVTARGAALLPIGRPALAAALRADADLPGFDEAHAGAIAAALVEILWTVPTRAHVDGRLCLPS